MFFKWATPDETSTVRGREDMLVARNQDFRTIRCSVIKCWEILVPSSWKDRQAAGSHPAWKLKSMPPFCGEKGPRGYGRVGEGREAI